MLSYLKKISTTRLPWLLLIAISVFGISFAKWVEITYEALPCNYCIRARYYLLLVGFSGVLGAINPRLGILRIVAILLFAYASFQGLMNGSEHLNYLGDRSPFKTCKATLDFLIPVQNYFPSIFTALGDCDNMGPIIFGFNLIFGTALLFAFLLAAAVGTLVVQFAKAPRHSSFR